MDYATLPPEINSGRMYTGAGSGSMQAAATAWDGLAAELRSAAASYSSTISGLTNAWLGPAAALMAAAATPYKAWLVSTATQAEQAANQARAAAAAYETAFAAMVPPPTIAANRAQLTTLISTNVLGQNTAAIAANQAQYASMWAQDAAAMYSYASQSAAATQLTPFQSPPQNTNPAGGANQAAALAQSAGTSAGTHAQSGLAQLTSATPNALQSLAAPAQATPPSPITALTDFLNSLNSSGLASIAGDVELIPKAILPANDIMISVIMGLVIGGRSLSDVAAGAAASASSATSGAESALGAGLGLGAPVLGSAGVAGAGSAVSAGVGQAGSVGGLAVPPSWSMATPAIKTAAAVLSGAGEGAVPAAAVSQGTLFSGIAGAGMAGAAIGAAGSRAVSRTRTTGRSGVSADDFKDLKDSNASPNLQRIVAEMADKPDSVQHWHTDSEHLDGLLAELQQKPGIHAVHVAKGGKPKMTPPKSQSI
jgi:PPE-repeat protein